MKSFKIETEEKRNTTYNWTYNEKPTYELCPEYRGVAKIVDYTEQKVIKTQWSEKPTFRFVLEIPMVRDEDTGAYHTLTTQPLRHTLHSKSHLHKIVTAALNRPLKDREPLSAEDMIGKYLKINAEHVEREETTYCNILSYKPAPEGHDTWDSNYTRRKDRQQSGRKKTDEEIEADFEELYPNEKETHNPE